MARGVRESSASESKNIPETSAKWVTELPAAGKARDQSRAGAVRVGDGVCAVPVPELIGPNLYGPRSGGIVWTWGRLRLGPSTGKLKCGVLSFAATVEGGSWEPGLIFPPHNPYLRLAS